MLKKADIDAVMITNKDHFPVIMGALNAGKHVVVEKPMVLNIQQANDVINLKTKSKKTLMVAYMKRYDPAYEFASKVIKGMNHIHMIRMHNFAGTYLINNEIYDLVVPNDLDKEIISRYKADFRRGELGDIGEGKEEHLALHDILLHLCIHDINVINGLFGIPDRITSAHAYDKLFINALMEYEDGKKVVWESGNETNIHDWDEQLWIYGESMRIEIRFPFPYLKNAATEVNLFYNEDSRAVQKQVITSFDEAFKREWRYFYDCVQNQIPPITSAEEALEDIRFMVDLLKAAT
jgi:predicted dehydrogenase